MERKELEKLSSKELHDQAMDTARRRLDAGFLWSVAKAIPVAEAASGHLERSGADVVSLTSLVSDLVHSGEGDVAEALRPLYLDYLEQHS